jgi:tRNA modification GTPase
MSTIVALSTPPGRSAIAVLRLSGPDAVQITRDLTRESIALQPRHATLATVYNSESGETIDRVLVTCMLAPNSFTGEDVIEISCHGSPVIVRQIVDEVLVKGARLANPGEFSLRAVANRKLDLSQAEAIRDLINAHTDAAAQQAIRQLNGELSNRLEPIKSELIRLIVRLESALEFVEDDLPAWQREDVSEKLQSVSNEIRKLVDSYAAGHWLRDGVTVTIAGRPNVGKSSLFNSLLKHDRAIVTALPGTTRDTLSEKINILGVPVSLTDTAGVRRTPDTIESIGIDRAHQAIADADLVLLVFDGTEELTEDDLDLFSQARDSSYLLVINKSDLVEFRSSRVQDRLGPVEPIVVSAFSGAGLDQLCRSIMDRVGVNGNGSDSLLITDARHHDLLSKSLEEIEQARELTQGSVSEEMVLVPLHNALTLLGAITGETTSEDILTQIFVTFCIGK